MTIIKNIFLLVFGVLFLSSCASSSYQMENTASQMQVFKKYKLAKLKVVGGWKSDWQNDLMGLKYDKKRVVKLARPIIYKELKKLQGKVPVNIHVSIEKFFVPKAVSSNGTGPYPYMTGRFTVINAKNLKPIKQNIAVRGNYGSPELFAKQIIQKMTEGSDNP